MANPFVHVELNTTDINKAKTFYGKLFEWTLEDVPMPGGAYTMIKPGKGTGGGMMNHPVSGAPSAWLAYVGWTTLTRRPKRPSHWALRS